MRLPKQSAYRHPRPSILLLDQRSAFHHINPRAPMPSSEAEVRAMHTVQLIQKLREIERALELEDRSIIRHLLIEAQECALRVQRETEEQTRRESRFVRVTH
jgi:hypothetical protein